MTTFKILIIVLTFGILSIFQFTSQAQETGRYLIMQNQMIFERVDELPYEILQPMCWDDTQGWCDEGMDDAGHRLVYLIDFATDRHGVVMQKVAGCGGSCQNMGQTIIPILTNTIGSLAPKN